MTAATGTNGSYKAIPQEVAEFEGPEQGLEDENRERMELE